MMRVATSIIATCVLLACTEGPSQPRIEGEWELTHLITTADFNVLDEGIWLSFQPDGQFIGQGACNDVEGEYRFNETQIEFGDVIASAVGCDAVLEDGTNLEDVFFPVLWADEAIEVSFTDDDSMTWHSNPALEFRRTEG